MVNSTRMSTNSETAMLSNQTFYIETRPHLLITIYGYHIYGRCNIGGLQYLGACSADQSATGLTALGACSASTFRFPLSLPSARLQASSSLNLLIQFYTNFIYITIITNMVLAMIIMMLSSWLLAVASLQMTGVSLNPPQTTPYIPTTSSSSSSILP